jgi:hypothetical protein
MIDQRFYVIGKYKPVDFETITVSNTAIGLTASKVDASPKPKRVLISVETAQCRFREDGTDPDATTGHILNPMDSMLVEGYPRIKNIKFIRTGANDAKLMVTYYL